MDLTGEYLIDASRQDVWDGLNNTEVLKLCIPGCEELEKQSDTHFVAKVTIKVGAVKARLKGNVELSDMDAPNSYTISGQGQGGVAGFAKGGAKVSLMDADVGGTVLRYEANAELGGKLAAVGSRAIHGISKKLADDFFGKFSAHLAGDPPGHPPTVTQQDSHSISPVPDRTLTSGVTRDFTGTARDILWLVIGIATGVAVTMAYFN